MPSEVLPPHRYGVPTKRSATATFGTDAKLVATPAYVIGKVVILGHPGGKALEKTIASMRQCGKVVC